MSSLLIVMIALFVLVVIGVMLIVGIYNKRVLLRNRFKNAYAQIDVQLKRRYDLIPNLVETAPKGISNTNAARLKPLSQRAMRHHQPMRVLPPIMAVINGWVQNSD